MPQAGPASRVLSNIYLHYVLDLWFERRFRKTSRSYAELTRFAGDCMAAFQNREDAKRFRQEMNERLRAFGLRVAPERNSGTITVGRTPSIKARERFMRKVTMWIKAKRH